MLAHPYELSDGYETSPNTREWRRLGKLAIEETINEGEVMEDIIIPEAGETILSTLEDRPEGKILLACGDDRAMTEESVRYLVSEGLPADKPYARYFGGLFGFTRVAMVSVAAQHGEAGLRKFMNEADYITFTTQTVPKIINLSNFIPTSHSSVKAEGNKARLNFGSPEHIACAYALNEGEVTYISGRNRAVQTRGLSEFRSLFGPCVDDDNFEIVTDANRNFAAVALGDKPREFSVSRKDLIENEIPSMILQGDHARSVDTFVLVNFSTDKLTNPTTAEAIGRQYYGADVTQTAEAIMRTFPEQKLNPELIFAAMIEDLASTRTALTAHDGPANPSRLGLVRYGDPEEALDYLRNLQY